MGRPVRRRCVQAVGTNRAGRLFSCLWLSGLLLAASPAGAALVDNGTITLDTETQLEWLDLTATAGLSVNDVLAGAGGWLEQGWRYATGAEVCSLYARFAVAPPGCPTSPRQVFSGQDNQVLFDRTLMDLLGSFVFQAAPGSQVEDSMTGCFEYAAGVPGLAFLRKVSGGGFPPFDAYSVGEDVPLCLDRRTEFAGHYLVRARTSVVSAILPGSRSATVDTTATVFASMVNASVNPAIGCTIEPRTALPADFQFWQTDPASNEIIGAADTPADFTSLASFLLALTPTDPIDPTEVLFDFTCENSEPAADFPGVNTLLFSASTTPAPDVIAIAATAPTPGTVDLDGAAGSGAFAVATSNVGSTGAITAQPNTGAAVLPLDLSVCETNPTTGACLSPPAAQVTSTIAVGATPTFAVFALASGSIAFEPAISRIYLDFVDAGGVVRGATSVAVRTLIEPTTRFTDNGNGTVTDNASGLVWLKEARCFDPPTYCYGDAAAAIAQLASGQCGLTDASVAGDWRLPELAEWQAFVCTQYSGPSLCNTNGDGPHSNGQPFLNVPATGTYWTGTVSERGPDLNWTMYLGSGEPFEDWNDCRDGFGVAFAWPVKR